MTRVQQFFRADPTMQRWLASHQLALFFALLACVFIAGCAASGPTQKDLVASGEGPEAKFALVELSDANIEVVSRWHKPSLNSLFGDYRAPKLQRIDFGDSVQIMIWEAGTGALFAPAALNERGAPGARAASIPDQVVARDGTIQVPYAGRINVAGKSPQQVEELIVKKLAGKSVEPQALVTISRNISNAVTITGDVTNGSRVPLSARGDRVLDVVATAGGVRSPVYETMISITRDGQTLTVPMQMLLTNPKENVHLRAGDVVTLVRAPQSFTVVGATGRQALVPFDAGGLTLEEAMGKAGGLLEDRADPAGVFVLRYEAASLVKQYRQVPEHLIQAGGVVPVAYRLNVKDPSSLFRARRFAVRDKDILYVSFAPVTELEKVVRLFGLVTAPAAAAAAGRSIAN
jgi:polysaccharide biosynthesis/export protein